MSKIIIEPEFQCETLYKDINKLLQRILNIHSKVERKDGSFLYDMNTLDDVRDLKLVLINILYEKTNIRDVLKKYRYTLDINLIDRTFNGLDPKSNRLYQEFLSNLNSFLDDIEETTYYYFFPLNLTFEDETVFDHLNKILKLFDITKVEIDGIEPILDKIKTDEIKEDSKHTISQRFTSLQKKIDPTKEEILDYLRDYNFIMSLRVKAKNFAYSNSYAIFKLESFLGLLSFSEYGFIRTFPFEPLKTKGSYNEIKYDQIVLFTDYRIIRPERHMLTSNDNSKRIVKLEGYKLLLSIYDEINSINNNSLWELLERLFFLYFKASSEDRIEYAFLNYWIIAETIIKGDGKPRSNDEVKSIMKSVIGDKIIRKRIDFLDKKRNHVVHRGEIVTIDERDLMKIIADQLLVVTIIGISNIKNKKQFGYYISNIRKKIKDRESLIEILELLNKEENQDSPKVS